MLPPTPRATLAGRASLATALALLAACGAERAVEPAAHGPAAVAARAADRLASAS